MQSFVPIFSTLATNLDIICIIPVLGSEEVEGRRNSNKCIYALSLAGMELVSCRAACMVLCFRLVTKATLITH